MIANTHYMTNYAGQFIYFLEFIVNTSRYAVQINSYPLDTDIQSSNGYILPTGATWSVPTTSTLSQFNINTTGFGEVLGYEIGSYPDTQVGSSTLRFVSSEAPQITPYSSILVSCNLVNNRAVIPSNILTSYTPLGASIGSLFTFEPNYLQFADVEDGQYTQLVLEFRDQQKYCHKRSQHVNHFIHRNKKIKYLNIYTGDIFSCRLVCGARHSFRTPR